MLQASLRGLPLNIVCHIEIIPNAFATELIRITAAKNRTQILDHKVEDLLSFESAIFLGHFFFDLSDAHHTGHQQAGCNGGYWHHHGVCEEVEEIPGTAFRVSGRCRADRIPGRTVYQAIP